jgi:hypothetical protein
VGHKSSLMRVTGASFLDLAIKTRIDSFFALICHTPRNVGGGEIGTIAVVSPPTLQPASSGEHSVSVFIMLLLISLHLECPGGSLWLVH